MGEEEYIMVEGMVYYFYLDEDKYISVVGPCDIDTIRKNTSPLPLHAVKRFKKELLEKIERYGKPSHYLYIQANL
jgi:hypothetical protein